MSEVDSSRIEELRTKLERDAKSGGYNLNNDLEFVNGLVEGLLINQDRYGYQSCPCRLGSGDRARDLDIICPCDYRDPDLSEYGACYCALYVTREVLKGERELTSIPERRKVHRDAEGHEMEQVRVAGLSYPVWRCKVCGYLCARPEPPEICPICKVSKDRFERFI
ncbi:MAG TPA: ferredoxin-thioredoxin reductase catalytic domain-containing protein [Armatimonadota bacterium]